MNHLITGAAGFIGSHLAKTLTARGQHVVAVDNLSGGWRENLPTRVPFVEADLADADLDILLSLWRPDYVWHLAAYAAEGLSHWVREFNVRNNWLASTRLINASIRHGVKRFVFTSSMAVYGSQEPPYTEALTPVPEDPYGIAKYATELDLRAAGEVFGLPYVIFRPHNVYGPHQNLGDPYRNVVGIFMRQALAGQPLTVFGDGSQTRAFSYITDIVDPMVNSIGEPVEGEVFNIGGEQVVTIGELAKRVSTLFGGTAIEYLPQRHEVTHAYCDHHKARTRLGFEPQVSLDEGLGWMKAWAETEGVRWSTTPDLEIRLGLPGYWRETISLPAV